MATNIGGVGIEIRGDDTHFERTLRDVRREAGRTGQTLTREFRQADVAARTLNNSIRTTGASIAAMAATLGAGVGLSAGIRTLADFSQGMSTLKAITQATDSQFVQLEQKAKILGATTRFSASQAADGMLFLARAGFDVDAVLGSIEGTLQLAQAGALDLGAAADIASNIISGFRLDVSETGRVVDVMAKIANSANTDITQLGEAMKFVAPVAAGLGVSVEEAAAAIGALSDAGLQSSLAGTGLRRLLSELESPATKSVKIFKELGVSIDEVRPSAVGLTPALQRLAAAGLDTGQALEVFGDRGGPAFEVLASSLPKVVAQTKALEDAGGTAARVATIMDDNLNGAILGTVSAMEALIIELGKVGTESAITSGFKGLADLLRLAARNADIVATAIVALSVRAILPFAIAAGGTAVVAAQRLGAQLVALNAIAGRTTTAFQILSVTTSSLLRLVGPLTLTIGLAAAAFVALARDAKKGRDAIAEAQRITEQVNKSLQDTTAFDPFRNLANNALDSIGPLQGVRDALNEITTALQDVTIAEFVRQASEIQTTIQAAQANLQALQESRARAVGAARPAGGRLAQEQGNIPDFDPASVRTEFDDEITRTKQNIAVLENRLRDMGREVFSGTNGQTLIDAFQQGGIEAAASALRQSLVNAQNVDVIEKEKNKIEELVNTLELAKSQGASEATLNRIEREINVAKEVVRLLGSGVNEATARTIAGEKFGFAPIEDGPSDKEARAAERQAEQRRVAEAQYEIDVARLQGNETLARRLEEQLEISQVAADLMEFMKDEEVALDMAIASVVGKRQQETAELQRQADLKRQQMLDSAAAAQEDAEATRALTLAQARGNEDEIRALEQILDFRQRVAYYQSQNMSAADAVAQAELDIDAQNVLRDAQFQQTITDQVAAGLEQGILTGDWGSVFKGILAKSTSEALSEAINDLASVLVDVIGGALKGSNFGGGIGSAIASIFGGGRAAGGSVLPGMRYLVGEQGPEMFVPSVPGSIVPKFEGPASVAQGGVPGIQSLSISAPFIVQGSITEEVLPRVQAMMAAQARELPRVIDARVSDSIRRNRY